MTREFKFRAWYKRWPQPINGEMRYFNLMQNDFGKSFDRHALDPIMQFTGLKDRNEKEIYEGDLYECGESIGEIKYKEDSFIIDWISNKDSWNEHLNRHLDGEVIGNIYENELPGDSK